MKLEKKLIICSIIAVTIGISSVLPLMFLMSATAQVTAAPEPWFSIDMPYSYWETLNGPLEYHPNMQFPGIEELNETNSVSEQHTIPLNITLTADPTKQPVDAQIEYYQIEVNSDKEHIMTKYFVVGTNGNSDFDVGVLLKDFHFNRNDWFNTDDFDLENAGGGGGLARQDWNSGTWTIFPLGGSGSGSVSASSTCREVDMLRAADSLTISLYRVGFVTFSGKSTTVNLANNELVDQIQLERYSEESFLYNDLIPEDELATIDLMRPISFESLP